MRIQDVEGCVDQVQRSIDCCLARIKELETELKEAVGNNTALEKDNEVLSDSLDDANGECKVLRTKVIELESALASVSK